jgi:hypothetical protein
MRHRRGRSRIRRAKKTFFKGKQVHNLNKFGFGRGGICIR